MEATGDAGPQEALEVVSQSSPCAAVLLGAVHCPRGRPHAHARPDLGLPPRRAAGQSSGRPSSVFSVSGVFLGAAGSALPPSRITMSFLSPVESGSAGGNRGGGLCLSFLALGPGNRRPAMLRLRRRTVGKLQHTGADARLPGSQCAPVSSLGTKGTLRPPRGFVVQGARSERGSLCGRVP